ncbi:MAG: tetratricopeptide repeat protein, partial [Treponemataceae bacterium]|nr:tetratricopeptide repeat protein [Treponemataceae bacterium]
MSLHSEDELNRAYENFSQFNPELAKAELSKALVNDLNNVEIMFSLKVASFWIARKNTITQLNEYFEQGERILSSWKDFTELFQDEISRHEQCIYSTKKGVFAYALNTYTMILQQNVATQKATVYSRIGLCHKILGNYEQALKFLSDANSQDSDNSEILAQMADCYALCGKEKTSKVLFREAFFIDAQNIDIQLLESELFCRLYNEVSQKYKNPEVAAEWVPVEGVLLGVFNVKRELRNIEVGKLLQSIFSLENELKNEGSQPEILVPRLINKCFWLVDHYSSTNEDRQKINENLMKIKLL